MSPLDVLANAIPAAQIAKAKEAMDMLKNMKNDPMDFHQFIIDPAWLTRVW
jgi:hypothetical protein